MAALPRRALLLAPLAIAAGAGVGFKVLLDRMSAGTYDPHEVPSMIIGHRLPDFVLPAQAPGEGFASADVLAAGHPVLLNFFASWCVPCVEEAPVLDQISDAGVKIWGIAYKDKEDAALAFLKKNGNPYQRLARDADGRVAIDFGLFGVPESYLVDRGGIVRWRCPGPVTPDIVRQQLQPLLRQFA